jgi:phosphate transport system substrate-binding protein
MPYKQASTGAAMATISSRLAYVTLALWLLVTGLPRAGGAAEGKFVVGGAQSLTPLAEKFSAHFRRSRPEVAVEIRRANSNYAINAVRKGEFQIGLVSRGLTESERREFHVEALGYDAIVLLSYSWNAVTALSVDQLRQIYLGKIINWQEVGGEDTGIVPLTREATSALHKTFIESLFGPRFHEQEKAFVLRASKEKVLRTIKRIRGSLGYGIVRMEEAENEGVKVLAVNGKLPTAANVQEMRYPFTRPLFLVAKQRPEGIVREWIRDFTTFADQSKDYKKR